MAKHIPKRGIGQRGTGSDGAGFGHGLFSPKGEASTVGLIRSSFEIVVEGKSKMKELLASAT